MITGNMSSYKLLMLLLKIQLEDSRRELNRLQGEGPKKDMTRPIMVEKSVNTIPVKSVSLIPSMTVIQCTRNPRESTSTPPLPLLSMETCISLWSVEGKVFPQFNLYHLYELQRDLFFIMTGKKIEELFTHEQFQTFWEFSVKLKVENLLTKILARKHLRLSDPFAIFVKLET